MKMSEVRAKAKGLGLNPGRMDKTSLIRSIQVKEGYEPCYKTAEVNCPHPSCCFKADCLSLK